MPKPPSPGEADILSLLADVYGGDAADLRERDLHRAVGEIEETHRRAAMAMRRLQDHGVPAPKVAARGTQAQGALPDPSLPAAPGASELPRAQQTSAGPGASPVQVVSGDGAQIDLTHHTLTHIIRPRGK